MRGIRTTQDIDFVVLQGQTPAAQQFLRASPDYEVKPRTNHMIFKEGAKLVEIEIAAPPALFKETFDQTTEVIAVGNMMVLKSALILNAECYSIVERFSEAKFILLGVSSGNSSPSRNHFYRGGSD